MYMEIGVLSLFAMINQEDAVDGEFEEIRSEAEDTTGLL